MDFRAYLERLRALPDQHKKIILWAIVVVLAVVMGFFWVRGAANNFSKIGESLQNIELPKVDLPDMPSLPDLSALENITPSDQDLIDPDLLENIE